MIATGALLLESRRFSDVRRAPADPQGASGALFWVGVAVSVIVPVLTYFPVQTAGKLIQPSALLPQNITTGLMAWALFTGSISLALLLAFHFTRGRAQAASLQSDGLAAAEGCSPRSLLLACLVVLSAYVALLVSDALFKTDFHFWVVAAKPLVTWLLVGGQATHYARSSTSALTPRRATARARLRFDGHQGSTQPIPDSRRAGEHPTGCARSDNLTYPPTLNKSLPTASLKGHGSQSCDYAEVAGWIDALERRRKRG
jgi:hypothetical protein